MTTDAAADPPDGPSGAAPVRCFLVEDSALIRQNLIATLEEMLGVVILGYAEDEGSAVQWAQGNMETACDVVVIDIFLKTGSGLEVLRRLRPLRPDTKLVVLTNYATADMRRRCLQLGADRVFDKSAELEEMLAYFDELGREPKRH